jgi:pimeloyl-ACP methyl ester carboxylesterase
MALEWDAARLVDVGGRRLAFREQGQGQPAVVLEMGLGAAGTSYDVIAQRIAPFIRVVWYDHAGVGRSDPAPRPRTIADLAADLQVLLHAAQIPPPYVLLGHSLGGLTVRYYQQRYPGDVVALVLIDAAHEEQREQLLAALPPEAPGELPSVAQYRMALAARWADPTANDEGIDNVANSALMRHCGPLADLPVVVVSRGRAQAPAGLPVDLVARREQAWRHMQCDLAALSSRSVHLIAERGGHLVHQEQPDLVVEGIRRALALVREREGHAPRARSL